MVPGFKGGGGQPKQPRPDLQCFVASDACHLLLCPGPDRLLAPCMAVRPFAVVILSQLSLATALIHNMPVAGPACPRRLLAMCES